MLHLLGQDHELGPTEAEAMGASEQKIMALLGWEGAGLIEAAGGGGAADSLHSEGEASV